MDPAKQLAELAPTPWGLIASIVGAVIAPLAGVLGWLLKRAFSHTIPRLQGTFAETLEKIQEEHRADREAWRAEMRADRESAERRAEADRQAYERVVRLLLDEIRALRSPLSRQEGT